MQAPNSIAQLVLVSLVAALHLLWFLFLRPMEQTTDAASELFTGIIEILTYAGGLTLVVLARTLGGSNSGPRAFLVISRVMLVFQAAGFLVLVIKQAGTITHTIQDLLKAQREAKLAKRIRDVANCASYRHIVVKRCANRWLNRVLRRPLPGWPRLGPWTLEEQALVLALIEYYYQHVNGAEVDEKLVRGLPSSVGYSFVWSVVGESPGRRDAHLARED